LRLPDYYWWENILLQKNANLNNSSSSSSSSILTSKKAKRLIKLQDSDENNEFIKLNEDNSIPISISDFKSSCKYTLIRHIRNDHCVHPNATLSGLFKGEKYYLKQDIYLLLPKSKWKLKMLSVKENEIEIKKLKGKNKEGEEMEWSVYGEWQTEPYRPPQAENGVIPTNEHGKVELWDGNESLLPGGCCLIRSNAALSLSTKLGIEAHHAIVGFERKGQITRPVIGGTVVLKEHKLLIESVS
jgi:xeroderma pigmentosum group C-complementing protein